MRSWTVLLALGLFATAGGAQAQETGRVLGTVVNDQGQPVASASVIVQGTRIGVVTGVDGRYLIPGVPVGQRTIVATLIGYGDATQAVAVQAGQSVMANFRLSVKAVELQGVVAVGYGTQQRRTVTGAVATVKASQIAEMPVTNAIKAIQGRVAGVDIVSTGNKPGDGISVRIRGVRSITANNDPLYVVDGVPIAGGIQDFNPDDIVSIDILKDAAATAIYGSRGANGVVLVTTKGAGAGGVRTQFTADMNVSAQRPYSLPQMMNMQQYVTMLQAAAAYNNVPTDVRSLLNDVQYAAYQSGQQTDWQSVIKRTGVQKNFQIGMNGISGNTRFNLSGSYFDQTGTAVGFDFNKINGTASVDHQQGRLRLGVTSNFTHSLQATALGDGLWGAARQQTGFGVPYDTGGLIISHPDGDPLAWNPLKAVVNNGVVNDSRRDRLFASAFATFKLADGIELRSNFGPDYTQASQGGYQGPDVIYPGQTFRSATYNTQTTFQYILDNMLQVNRDFGSIHHIDATLLYGIQKYRQVTSNESAQQIPYDAALYYALGRGQNFTLATGLTESALNSYMGRVVYTLMDRYTLSAALRRDGTSVLAPGHKWVTFPTFGAAWQLGDEPFMKQFDWLSTLKLRGSYGKTGNSAISAYQTQGALLYTLYNFGATTASGWTVNPSNPPNPNLGWETTTQTDAAADFGLFDNRLTGTVDWYVQNTSDLLLTRSLPATSGFTSALQNVGKTKNTGIEFTLSSINLQNWHGLRWQTDVNWAHNKNEIVSLAALSSSGCPTAAPQCDLNNGWFVGFPVNISGSVGTAPADANGNCSAGVNGCDWQRRVWYDYKFLGIWQQNEAADAAKYGSKPGQIKILDANGDGKIDANDRVIQGNTYPTWTANIYNRLNWKSLDLSVLAQIRWNYTLYNSFIPSLYGRNGQIVSDYWTPSTPVNDNPSPNLSGNTIQYGNTRGYQGGSNWRIRNIQIGYTVPDRIAGRFGAKNARIYATATEPFVSYKYTYFDPESGYGGGSPLYRTLLIGANVGW